MEAEERVRELEEQLERQLAKQRVLAQEHQGGGARQDHDEGPDREDQVEELERAFVESGERLAEVDGEVRRLREQLYEV